MNEHLKMLSEKKAPAPCAREIPAAALQVVAEETTTETSGEWATFAGSVLFVIAGLVVIGFWARLESLEPAPAAPRELAANKSATAAREPLVHHFDGSQPIKRGDIIVFETPFLLQAKPVVVAARETLVVRRGLAVESLYIMGPQSYLVDSEDNRTVVRAEKIRGTLAGSHSPAQ